MGALHKLKQKLKSQTGASITFALLLFLVCAVVGSAVLVAGTAAAGRMSKIAEMDQRYYAVNSAARLLVETIEKETVTAVKTKATATNGSGAENNSESGGSSGTANTSDDKLSFPRDAAKKLGFLDGTGVSLPVTTKYMLSEKENNTEVKKSIETTITETVYPDGSMIFEVSKGKGTDYYALKLTFELDKQETTELNLQKNTETTTTILDWRLSDIETVSYRPSPTVSPVGTGG